MLQVDGAVLDDDIVAGYGESPVVVATIAGVGVHVQAIHLASQAPVVYVYVGVWGAMLKQVGESGFSQC